MQNIVERKWKNLIMNKGKKFDIILANPPFNLGERMLIKWFDIANEICTVQPSTWLLGKKQKKDIVKNVDAWGKTEIESIQGNEFFDAGISGVMAIQHFIRGKEETQQNGDYDKQIVFNGKEYDKCEEITLISNDKLLMEFKSIIEPLYQKDSIQNYIKYVPGIKSHAYGIDLYTEKDPDPNWICVKMSAIRGNVAPNGSKRDDFYTFLSNDKNFKIIDTYNNFSKLSNTKTGNKSTFAYYYPFNNIVIAYNFINYLKTDFARACLYLVKTSTDVINGCLKTIPWFNFNDPIFSKSPSEIDDYLFKKYNISDEIRKYIEEILPDYYGIRK